MYGEGHWLEESITGEDRKWSVSYEQSGDEDVER
jgi:hypothetical protein